MLTFGFLSVCLSVCPYACCLCVCLCVCLTVCLSICQSGCVFVCQIDCFGNTKLLEVAGLLRVRVPSPKTGESDSSHTVITCHRDQMTTTMTKSRVWVSVCVHFSKLLLLMGIIATPKGFLQFIRVMVRHDQMDVGAFLTRKQADRYGADWIWISSSQTDVSLSRPPTPLSIHTELA